ncbi:uncharacterized protein LOC131228633 [Magnolia sinica]|uniref:uncharacterized protein LOC131228633 n=1 Tax=Magnolia sinica TaxID=86752 RepID=UPI002658AE83|nr:uncharacterized protein LOC131228633 [Magnolia sinica]XP_058080406.1 uncharacterized protein LOC131228633 [Magnolia sinica]
MDSHRPFSQSFTNSSVVAESETPRSEFSNSFSSRMRVHQKEPVDENSDGFIGILEIFIHQARDIHNICIYHKQDVYAKLCLTSDPEVTVSTQIVNGGGKNPVFNENLRLNVRTIESSLKCEVWMLSRVKNYLEDQLLGFALVPLSDVLVGNGKLVQEFSLSSTDLFHSPAGFVQLSLSYNGSSPDVLAISAPQSSVGQDTTILDSEAENSSLPSEYTKIEFPDLKMVNENQLMVSEYFEIQCANLDSQGSESLATSDNDNQLSSEIGVHAVESFSTGSLDSVEALKSDTPPSSVSTNGSPAASIPATSQSVSGPLGASKSLNEDNVSPQEVKSTDVAEGEADSSSGPPNNTFAQSVLNMKVEPEQSVVQQEIIDMYMKSMQQFTESLAKMKLPMDIENGNTNSENGKSSSDQKLQASKGTGSRVFYGSRAFF